MCISNAPCRHTLHVAILGRDFFPCKFFRKIAFVIFPCGPSAFRLRRLAQIGRPDLGPRHFPCKFFRKLALVSPFGSYGAFRFSRANGDMKSMVKILWLVNFHCGRDQ